MTRRTILAVAALAMFGTQVSAAHLGDIRGSVLINNQPAAANMELAPGDRITVESGEATIIYGNGATASIRAGQTAVVRTNAPVPYSMKDGPGTDPYVADDDTDMGLVVGGTILLGAGLAIALSHQSSSPNQLSP